MDDGRFDEIAKKLAVSPSRRSLLRSCGAIAVAAVAGGLNRHGALAAGRALGAVCSKNGDCTSGTCGPQDRTGRRYCACSSSQEACGANCVNPAAAYLTDKKNCGACGVVCSGSNVCCQGACVTPQSVCNGVCCTGGQICHDNACCLSQSHDITCAGQCGPRTDNCGVSVDCGSCCAATGLSCTTNSQCCSTVCIGNVCAAGPVIVGENCDENADCLSGACCGGTCVASTAYDSDVSNCGTCGHVCPGQNTECSTVACTAGSCGSLSAPSGTLLINQTPGDCQSNVCDGAGGTTSIANDVDVPSGATTCVLAICTAGVPSHPNAPLNTPCTENGGTHCDGGICCPAGQRKSAIGSYCVPDAAACAVFTNSANLANKDFRECDFSGQTFVSVGAAHSDFTGANFAGAHLTSVSFQYSSLNDADFTGGTLTSMDFRFANLTGANFGTVTFICCNAWSDASSATTCPDAVGITTGTCCSHMNGNTPTTCL